MDRKFKKLMGLLLAFIVTFSLASSVLADDDDHEKRENEHNSESYEKSDDETEESYDDQGTTAKTEPQADYWNIWSRQPNNNPNNPLPSTVPSELSVNVNGGGITKLYFIPREGQLLVSGEAMANLLGAKAKYYPQSKIMVITKDKYELIVRADSNAAYENKVKNPMPVKAASYEKTVYLPVSVAANALGFRITWSTETNTLIFNSI